MHFSVCTAQEHECFFLFLLKKSILITYVIVQLTVIIIMYAMVPVTEVVIKQFLKEHL